MGKEKKYNVESFESDSHKGLEGKINEYLNTINGLTAINVSISYVLNENQNLTYYGMILFEYI